MIQGQNTLPNQNMDVYGANNGFQQPQPYYVPRYAYPQPQYQVQPSYPQVPQNYPQTPAQQPQLPVQTNTLNGKVVDSIDVVKATDIPMDGNTYYFPKADHTEVYSKRWLANGTTETLIYRIYMEQPKQPEPAPAPFPVEEWTGKLDSIDERVSRLEKTVNNNKTTKPVAKQEETK